MCNVIYIAGEPASGKTTIFKRIREELFQSPEEFRKGSCRGIRQGNLYMLGLFDGSKFEGTDRLAMACIGDCIDYLSALPNEAVVLIEGDRLLNERFIRATGAKVYIIKASPEILAKRHFERADTQCERFLKGRRTKIENLRKKFGLPTLINNTPEQSAAISNGLIRLAERLSGQT